MNGASHGTIQIRGLRCRGRQGTTAEERAQEHEYLVDVSVVTDLGPAIAADDVRSATDISAIAQVIRDTLAERPRALVERITADVAAALLQRFPEAREVRVRVEKPQPAGLGADAESIELTLRR